MSATTAHQSPKDVIKAYLDARAQSDTLFAASYAKPAKNIDDCFRYILGEARKRGTSVCMTDDEVFGLAVHYYDEDDIKISPVRQSSRSSVSPGSKEKVDAIIKKAKAKVAKAAKKSPDKELPKPDPASLPSLFDFADL